MHSHGNQGGLYGSACAPDIDIYATISAPPDDVWAASQNGSNDVVNISCLNPGYRVYEQRIHQFTGGQWHTWGGATVFVDLDCVKADVVGLADYRPGC